MAGSGRARSLLSCDSTGQAGRSADCSKRFPFRQSETVEPLRDEGSGEIRRCHRPSAASDRRHTIEVRIDERTIRGSSEFKSPLKVTVRILNQTPFENADQGVVMKR